MEINYEGEYIDPSLSREKLNEELEAELNPKPREEKVEPVVKEKTQKEEEFKIPQDVFDYLNNQKSAGKLEASLVFDLKHCSSLRELTQTVRNALNEGKISEFHAEKILNMLEGTGENPQKNSFEKILSKREEIMSGYPQFLGGTAEMIEKTNRRLEMIKKIWDRAPEEEKGETIFHLLQEDPIGDGQDTAFSGLRVKN